MCLEGSETYREIKGKKHRTQIQTRCRFLIQKSIELEDSEGYSRGNTGQCVLCVLHVPTCMAPRFSVSCSGLDVPRRTELTPSFLRHHAREKQRLIFMQSPLDGALLLIIVFIIDHKHKLSF